MRVKIINLILLIASWLPVFSLTEDEKYGELKIDNSIAVRSQLRTWRLSLFQIMLGAYKFYILTLSRTYDNNTNKVLYHPKLFKLISLKKIFDKNDHHIEQIYNDYYMRLNNSKMTEDRLEKEKESLCYHIEVENSRLEKSDNKMNIYTTVLLTALPILLGISFDSILLLFKTNMIYKAFFIISAYFVMNIVLYLFQYIKVGKYNMSRFSTLKEEQDENLTQRLVSQYYYDYQFFILQFRIVQRRIAFRSLFEELRMGILGDTEPLDQLSCHAGHGTVALSLRNAAACFHELQPVLNGQTTFMPDHITLRAEQETGSVQCIAVEERQFLVDAGFDALVECSILAGHGREKYMEARAGGN